MINILYLINYAGKGGTEKYIETLTENLNKKEFEIFLCYNENGELKDSLEKKNIKCKRLEMKNPFDIISAYKLSKYCRENKIDIIHTHFMRENYIALLSKIFYSKVKVIYTNHITIENNIVIRFFNNIFTKMQSEIISVCNHGKEVLKSNGFDSNKITVIFNGINIDYWSKEYKSTIRSEFDIEPDKVILLSTSRFTKEKGHEFLIDSISVLRAKGVENFVLLLTNDGPLLEEMKNKVSKLNLNKFVKFVEHRKDVKNLLYGSNIFLNSSIYEALSFAILEAISTGRVVLATDTAGTRDIINNNENGFLVKYGEVDKYSEKIKELIANNKELLRISQNALRTANEKFDIHKMIGHTEKIYKKVLI